MRKVGIRCRTNLIVVLFVCFDVQTTRARRARFEEETRAVESARRVVSTPRPAERMYTH